MQKLINKKDIIIWLNKMNIKNYFIHDDLTVDVNGDVNLTNNKITFIPIQFGIVKGYFDCSFNQLTSLKGIPKEVYGYFYCSFNQLTSLKYSPNIITDSFYCTNNKLITLEGCPKKVYGNFNCSFNQLTSLKYGPEEIDRYFNCSFNQLTTLEHIFNINIKGNIYYKNIPNLNLPDNLTVQELKDYYQPILLKKKLDNNMNNHTIKIIKSKV